MKTASIIRWAIARQIFDPKNGAQISWVPSRGASLCLVLGENATGKSLFRRAVSAWCRTKADKRRAEMIGLSMQDRAGGMMGIAHVFVYGDEHSNSTGVNSAHTVTTGIKTALDRTQAHVIFWDEPDVGLSDSYAAGIGKLIAEFAQKPGARTQAIFVCTHRKVLVEQLLVGKPHVVFLGENPPRSVEEWLARPVVPGDVEELFDKSLVLFRKIAKILK